MQTGTLLQEIIGAGLDIQAIDGNLHVSPKDRITDEIRASIRTNKTALLDLVEAYEERAAIMEHDGGMSREEAEKAAFEDVCFRP